MAKQASTALTSVQSVHPASPPHRIFRERPIEAFSLAFLDYVRNTGDPESFPGLYMGRINKDEPFFLLKKFEIEKKKRLDGKKAYCPRCNQHDKYLRGDLAWFPNLMACAAIGNCCAGHDVANEADKEFKARTNQEHRETYLLSNLPLMAAKIKAAKRLRRSVEAALAVYRQFRLEVPKVHHQLRGAKVNHGGHLIVTKILRSKEQDTEHDYFGPAGFRRGGNVEAQETDLGLMSGQIALIKDFQPEKELDAIQRQLESIGSSFSDEETMDFILKHDAHRLNVAVVILQSADEKFAKLSSRLTEFWSFFTRANIELINRYGAHEESPLNVQTSFAVKNGRIEVRFKTRDQFCRLMFDLDATTVDVGWP